MTYNPLTARNDFFKELKPKCVSINDLAVKPRDKRAAASDLVKVVEELSAVVEKQAARDASVLDHKLADYVFFPLSNILRNQQEYPIRLTELTVRCLRFLVQYGWKDKIPADLTQQLIILLTFIIGGVPGQTRSEPIPEETEVECFQALAAVIAAAGSSGAGAAALVETNAVPNLGHAVSVVLEGANTGRTPEIQLESLDALDALRNAIKDRTALATFLPGVVSSLSRLLTPPISSKSQRRVLIKGIESLQDTLTKVLSDIKVMALLDKPSKEEKSDQVLTAAWLKASSAKIKLALASVLKLRNHTADNVRSALEKLCVSLLDECHRSLSECAPLLVESAMVLSSQEAETSAFETSLVDLARIYPELSETIKSVLYNWMVSLPRLMQTSDEHTKQVAVRNLLKGQRFVTNLQIDSTTLDASFNTSLRDSVVALLGNSKPSSVIAEPLTRTLADSNTAPMKQGQNHAFQPVLVGHETEKTTREAILDLIHDTGSRSNHQQLASSMLDFSRESTGPSQVASFWLAFELVKSVMDKNSDVDEFLDLSAASGPSEDQESVFSELYTFSVGILDSHSDSDDMDWRMQALAIEVATFAASRSGEGFRPELIDVLYPIATFMGSEGHHLRDHAFVSLNSIAVSCGYDSVATLVIDNVDYMLNSVSLRLNTFDISPASTQVLRMMVRLTGPRLVPYLDDVVASIFAALDNFHGYPLLVESLFSVLTEIAQQGSRSDAVLIESDEASQSKKDIPVSHASNAESILDARLERDRIRKQEEMAPEAPEPHPERPWKSSKSAKELLDEATQDPAEATEDESEGEGEGEGTSAEVEKAAPPQTPTFLLLARITGLTQHFLTSPTPMLRKSLLDLLSTVCPALSGDETAFLPLVNSVWPVLVERLYDPEHFVVIAACRALGALCASAKDFLGTRIKTEWWDSLGKWCKKTKREAEKFQSQAKPGSKKPGVSGKGDKLLIPIRPKDPTGIEESVKEISSTPSAGLGQFAQAAQVWEATQELLLAIVSHVRVDDEIFDEVVLLLGDTLASNPATRATLEGVDEDAVWLYMYQHGAAPRPVQPVLAGARFVEV